MLVLCTGGFEGLQSDRVGGEVPGQRQDVDQRPAAVPLAGNLAGYARGMEMYAHIHSAFGFRLGRQFGGRLGIEVV
ncbi:hypothetical protein [Streptomyces sp. NPDC005898]|uniref:hypothetical protein n=1 Tax=Streptomyces sp. NPDC005898 TaxID=3157082 RepID=UPI003410E037